VEEEIMFSNKENTFLAMSSAKPDNIFWKKIEETLFGRSI
jgi:hypothetical protein